MNEKKAPWWLIVGGGALVGLLLVACLALVLRFTGLRVGGDYRSNGEQIYFTATSQRGTPVTSDISMGMMGGGMQTSATAPKTSTCVQLILPISQNLLEMIMFPIRQGWRASMTRPPLPQCTQCACPPSPLRYFSGSFSKAALQPGAQK